MPALACLALYNNRNKKYPMVRIIDPIRSRIRLKRQRSSIGIASPHYAIFLASLLLYMALLWCIINDRGNRLMKSISESTFPFLTINRMLISLLFIKAVRGNDIYEYYVALFILLEKLCIMIFCAITNTSKMAPTEAGLFISITALVAIEIVYVIASLFFRRFDIINTLFAIAGASPAVNSKCKIA